jgi:hypothetical protein
MTRPVRGFQIFRLKIVDFQAVECEIQGTPQPQRLILRDLLSKDLARTVTVAASTGYPLHYPILRCPSPLPKYRQERGKKAEVFWAKRENIFHNRGI